MQVIEVLFTHIEEPHDYLHIKHASAALTLDRYADLFDDDLDTVADRLEAVRAAGVARVLPNTNVVDLGSSRPVARGQ